MRTLYEWRLEIAALFCVFLAGLCAALLLP
jgi:hypothetical protein